MSHSHSIYDTDKHFLIDPNTRSIVNQSDKLELMQNDHNSERFTFELPRYVEGHDMIQCNRIEVHYINVSRDRKSISSDVYSVLDLNIDLEDENIIIFSWLISRNATVFVGKLNFRITFKCINEDSVIDYEWNTAIFSKITISSGIDNSESTVTEFSDILEHWREQAVGVIEKNNKSIDLLNQNAQAIVNVAETLDKYIGDYEARELVTSFTKDDLGTATYFAPDVDLTQIIDIDDDTKSFEIHVKISFDGTSYYKSVVDVTSIVNNITSSDSELYHFYNAKGDLLFIYRRDDNVFDMSAVYSVSFSEIKSYEMSVYRIYKSVGDQIGKFVDAINGEVI